MKKKNIKQQVNKKPELFQLSSDIELLSPEDLTTLSAGRNKYDDDYPNLDNILQGEGI
jgi:hypothetical protein